MHLVACATTHSSDASRIGSAVIVEEGIYFIRGQFEIVPEQNGLLVVGGLQLTGSILAQSFIFELTCPKTGCQWTLLDQKLKEPRGYHVGFLSDYIDSPLWNCTST
mgnify:CR=1 FL=1